MQPKTKEALPAGSTVIIAISTALVLVQIGDHMVIVIITPLLI